MGTMITPAVEKLDEIEKTMAGKELGDEIERLRVKAGWTQGELAQRIGLHQTRVSKIESGEHNFPLETVYRLAVAFNINPFELAAIYWGIEVEELSNKDKELLNNLLKLFDDYRKDVPPLQLGRPRHLADAQTYVGLDEASNITDEMNQSQPNQEQPLPKPESEDETL